MPAGDLLVADWQVEIGGLLTGSGTNYRIARPGVSGLGVPDAKTADTPLGHAAGAFAGRDYTASRVITIPYVIALDTPTAAGGAFRTLSAKWVASADQELHIQMPGFGHLKVVGRARGFVEDLDSLRSGVVRCLATFVCPNPTITYIP